MNRMDKVFNEMQKENEKILVTYYPIGDTIFDSNVAWCNRYFKNGATVLEIGLPYENPVLDGKVVRESMGRALNSTTLDNVFNTIKELREKFPNNIMQIMTYYEIIKKDGIAEFAEKCHNCGVDAVLSPNAPVDKMLELDSALKKYNIHNLRFAPFNLTNEIIDDLKKNAKGYIFLQAVDGPTGPQETVSSQIKTNVETLKEAGIKTPVVAGFGISNPNQVEQVIQMGADGCIVGSSVINSIVEGNGETFIKELRVAMS